MKTGTTMWTSRDLSMRVELGDNCVLFSADHGMTWHGLNPDDARSLAAGLCVAAERVDEQETERAHAA